MAWNDFVNTVKSGWDAYKGAVSSTAERTNAWLGGAGTSIDKLLDERERLRRRIADAVHGKRDMSNEESDAAEMRIAEIDKQIAQIKASISQNEYSTVGDSVNALGRIASSIAEPYARKHITGEAGENRDSSAVSAQRDAADLTRKQAERMQADAQRSYQIANRDPRVEADKDAATAAAAQFTQRMQQQSAAAGAGAAALAAQSVQDPSQHLAQHRQRADTQHQVAMQTQEGAELAEAQSLAQRARADEMNRDEVERNQREKAQVRLSTQQARMDNARLQLHAQHQLTQQINSETDAAERNELMRQAVLAIKAAMDGNPDVLNQFNAAHNLQLTVPTWSDRRMKRIIKVVARRF